MDEKYRNLLITHLNELVDGTGENELEKILHIFKEKKILHPWMIQKIRNSDNKQKTFYEMVPKRGPHAFRDLLEALKDVGLNNLCSLLSSYRLCSNDDMDSLDGMTTSRFRNNNSEDNLDEEVSNENGCSKDTYHIKSKPKGLVLIINNSEFPYKKHISNYDRRGSEKDVANIESKMKLFGYEVKKKSNFKSEDLKNYLKMFVQKEKLKKIDSLIVFFMSHGRNGDDEGRIIELECTDNLHVESAWLLQQFDSINCPDLAEKPKAVFFVACRGANFDAGITIAADSSKSSYRIVPKFADMLIVYSTSPNHVSLREPDGTLFVKSFCAALDNTKQTTLLNVINQVSRELKNQLQIIHSENFGFDKKFPLIRE